MNDVAFHYVFGRESRKYNLLNLLNAILVKDEQSQIRDLTLLETHLTPETIGLKSCRLDVRALTAQNHHINIEVQLINQANMEKRSLYYWSKLYTAQLVEGQDYRELNKTIAINILDFQYLANEKFHSIYRVLEIEKLTELTGVLEIHFLELPRLKEYPLDLSCPLTRWLLFLSDQTDLKMKEAILMQDKNIQNAYEDLEKLAADKDTRRLYEIREKAARDLRSNLYEARQRGLKEGLQQGLQEGLQQGLLQGLQQGQKERILLILKMLEEGLDEGLIKNIADLTQEQLNEIKTQAQSQQ